MGVTEGLVLEEGGQVRVHSGGSTLRVIIDGQAGSCIDDITAWRCAPQPSSLGAQGPGSALILDLADLPDGFPSTKPWAWSAPSRPYPPAAIDLGQVLDTSWISMSPLGPKDASENFERMP